MSDLSGAVDLSRGPALSEETERDALAAAEVKGGLRCSGCGRRIGVGFRFRRFEVASTPRGVAVRELMIGACSGEDCDFAERARENATVVEMVEYAWLDGGDEPVPSAMAG